MKILEKSPVLSIELSLPASSGIYVFYTKSVAKLVSSVATVLQSATKLCSELYIALVCCLWVVVHDAHKLEGICSISSSVCDNAFCQARRKIDGCICQHCYAQGQQDYRAGLKEHNMLNGIILRNFLIPTRFFKALRIICPYLRIESFGDVMNVTQARNYIRIIKAFPRKRCAIWSKNISVWESAFQLEGKPKNTTYVHSSLRLNVPDTIDLKRHNFVDHIFTVYEKDFAKENGVAINCGGRKCLDCIRKREKCYFRNETLYINELKK